LYTLVAWIVFDPSIAFPDNGTGGTVAGEEEFDPKYMN
jgi:hypothetical protein